MPDEPEKEGTGIELIGLKAVAGIVLVYSARLVMKLADAPIGAHPQMPQIVLEKAVNKIVGESLSRSDMAESATFPIESVQSSPKSSQPETAIAAFQNRANIRVVQSGRMVFLPGETSETRLARFVEAIESGQSLLERANPENPGPVLVETPHLVATDGLRIAGIVNKMLPGHLPPTVIFGARQTTLFVSHPQIPVPIFKNHFHVVFAQTRCIPRVVSIMQESRAIAVLPRHSIQATPLRSDPEIAAAIFNQRPDNGMAE